MLNEYTFKYGASTITIPIGDHQDFDVIQPPDVRGAVDPAGEVRKSLNSMQGNSSAKILPGNTVAIAINDKTRPVPHQYLLPPLLEFLRGMASEDQILLFS